MAVTYPFDDNSRMSQSPQQAVTVSFSFNTSAGPGEFSVQSGVNERGDRTVEVTPKVVSGVLPWDQHDQCIPMASGIWRTNGSITPDQHDTFLLRVSNEVRLALGLPLHPATGGYPGTEPTR